MSELISMDDLSYKLPITNGIFILVILSYFVPFLLTPNQIHNHLICKTDLSILIPSLDWIKFLLSRFVFLDFKNYFFFLVLLTIFRTFERIYGSKKFVNYMFTNFIVSSILELSIINLLNYFDFVNITHLANGCYSYIFALYINYCKDIPKENFDFYGFSFSEKLLVYFFGIHMMFTSYPVLVASLSGLISGLICRSNAFNVCDLFKLPNQFLDSLIDFLNFILLSNNLPKEPILNGATQNDRRQQYIEMYEENLINDQLSFMNQSASSSSSSDVSRQSEINEQEFEQNINQLKDMGFELEKAKKTLKSTNNNLSRATDLLLEDS